MDKRNKLNLHYFESDSMLGLYNVMDQWQRSNEKRLLSTSIHKDRDLFCCIALANPTEVVLCHSENSDEATVTHEGRLIVYIDERD